ncbi:MAG: DUF4115 domain-containing protein [Alphaproteobacteria bacterium]|nr:DUF4115 domain-containing protein [Alphaproteobacteria bacterium]
MEPAAVQYQHYPEPDPSAPAPGDVPVGVILRQARQHYGQSLADIEKALRIKRSQLEAIESGEYDRLPGRVYAIGFIRSYSDYLGLDGEQMIAQFKIQVGERSSAPELHFPMPTSESKVPKPWVVVVSLFTAAVIIILWWSYAQRPPEDTSALPDVMATEEAFSASTPAIPNAGASAPASATAAQQPVAHASPTAPPPEPGIILSITANSWVEIKDSSGNALVAKVLQAGDKYRIPDDRPDLSMSLGNAGGVMLEIDGKAVAPLGANGEVLRNVPLERDWLRKRYETQPQPVPPDTATEDAAPSEATIEPEAGTPTTPVVSSPVQEPTPAPPPAAPAPAVSVAPAPPAAATTTSAPPPRQRNMQQPAPVEDDVPDAAETVGPSSFGIPNR